MPAASQLPVDRGWAFVVLLAAFVNQTIVIGTIRAFGIVFVEFVQYFGGSASMTALTVSLAGGINLFCAPLISGLAQAFTSRVVVMCGAILACLGLLLASQATSLLQAILAIGLIFGPGYGSTLTPSTLMLSTYFRKRRTLAQGIVFAGSGVGGTLMPFVVYYFVETFGLHGTLMMLSGLVLQASVGGALYRPASYYGTAVHDVTNIQSTVQRRESQTSNYSLRREALLRSVSDSASSGIAGGEKTLGLRRSCMDISLTGSFQNIPTAILEENTEETEAASDPVPVTERVRRFLHNLCTVRNADTGNMQPLVNLTHLNNGQTLIFFLASCAAITVFWVTVVVPPRALEVGLSKSQATVLLFIVGVADTLGRAGIGLLGDWKYLCERRMQLLIACLLFGAGVFMIGAFVSSFWAQACIYVVACPVFGASIVLMPVVLNDMVQPENLASAWGLNLFFEGFSVLSAPVIFGLLADVTGSYAGSFVYMSANALVGSLLYTLCLFWPRLWRCESREPKREAEIPKLEVIIEEFS